MNSQPHSIALACLRTLLAFVAFITAQCALSQAWVSNTVPSLQWSSVASSADGSHLQAAVNGGPIYSSTNSGATWATNNAPASNWVSVASSADGIKLAAAIGGNAKGGIYTSTNAGATWKLSGANNSVSWRQVVSSADGTRLFAATAASPGNCYYSTNSGTNWTIITSLPVGSWSSVACSANGMTLIAALSIDGVPTCVSTNAGVSWITNNSLIGMPGAGVASSADGSRLFVVTAGFTYVSTNSGVSFTQVAAAGRCNVIAYSADGTQLFGVFKLLSTTTTNFYSVVTSTNSGAAWTTNIILTTGTTTEIAVPVAMSADGSQLIFAGTPGPVFTLQTVPNPQLNITLLGNNPALSWIVPSTNFVVQQSQDLSTWSSLTNAPALNLTTLQDQILLSPTNSNEFYRLATP